MKKKKNVPWYRNWEYWVEIADQYILASKKIRKGSIYDSQINTFTNFNIAKVIFESNLIEGAGLSLGETKKLITKYFPEIPDDYRRFSNFQKGGNIFEQLYNEEAYISLMETIKEEGYNLKKIIPSIRMSGKSRSYKEVLQHYMALLKSLYIASNFTSRRIEYLIAEMFDYEEVPTNIKDRITNFFTNRKLDRIEILKSGKNVLLTEDIIKDIHIDLAKGLLQKDAVVKAGNYRIDDRIVGWDFPFPSPDLVPEMMKTFVTKSNKTIDESFNKNISMYEAAAKVSFDFVNIHPFPDFNGRLSRILMNMVLSVNMCPFLISIKGDKKGRHRYFQSLKRAHQSSIIPLASLIAMRIVDTFTELDNQLKYADLNSILSFSEKKVSSEKSR